jgi:hypothetical protein
MGLDTKTYWLTDRQSQYNFDFDFVQDLLIDWPSIEMWLWLDFAREIRELELGVQKL